MLCRVAALLATSLPGAAQAPLEPSARTELGGTVLDTEAAELFAHVQFLAHERLRGRKAGSAEDGIAAAYIATRFAEYGLRPALASGEWEQPVDFQVAGTNAEGVYDVHGYRTRNVLALLPGSDPELAHEHIVVGAHFDHEGVRADGAIYFGADDNASGVAGLLGLAKRLAQGPERPRRTVVFAAFGAEEVGLRGSTTYTQAPALPLAETVCMINLDMIGRPEFLGRKSLAMVKSLAGVKPGPGVGVLGGKHAPELLELARAAAARAELPLYAPQDFPALIRDQVEAQAAGRADHVPFERKRVPCLFFSTSEHDDYHQPTDTVDKLDAATLLRVTRVTCDTLLAIDALDTRPTFVD